MQTAEREKIRAFFEAHQAEMLQDLRELVAIPSVRSAAQEGMPFGPGPRMVLDQAIALMQRHGLRVSNYDNCVCTGDLTELPSGLDILAHLDVVPVENNWTVCKPYEPKLVDGRLYGRGTIDDKGPAVAALYAMLCVRSLGIPLKKNVRLVLGTDEECGSEDLEHYYNREPEAPMTFTPDANFPLINVEKGRLCGEIDATFRRDDRLPCIVSAESGVKTNVIPETATAVIAGMTAEELRPYLDRAAQETGARYDAAEEQSVLKLVCTGKGGHAAYPEGTNNALTALLHLLAELPCADSEGFRRLKALQALFPHGAYYGQGLGLSMEDDVSGKLTLSANLLDLDETSLYLCFDARCPVCASEENTHLAAKKKIEAAGLSMRETALAAPHYVSADSDFVRTLLRAYSDWTGKEGKAEATGGGTYVHELQNGVAFGCELPGLDNHLHGADEFITMEQWLLSAQIFTQAILDLCT